MPRERHVTFRTDTAKHEARGHGIRSYELDWQLRLLASVAVHRKRKRAPCATMQPPRNALREWARCLKLDEDDA